ncbi:unnamed protein product [Effrenium voratum]|nr:unnamed protein product [Effrenium voratum]
MLFQELRFLERFKAAKRCGFGAVEISTPELFQHSPQEVASILDAEGLECVLFNMPAGDWAAGERGLAAQAARKGDFEAALQQAAEYVKPLRCPRVHCLAGLHGCRDTYRSNLARAVEVLGAQGAEVVIEPINQRSMPGYHLASFPEAAATISEVAAGLAEEQRGKLKLLFDVFHCQILHGDLTMNLRKYADLIGHVQIAGVPDRHEPDRRSESPSDSFRSPSHRFGTRNPRKTGCQWTSLWAMRVFGWEAFCVLGELFRRT